MCCGTEIFLDILVTSMILNFFLHHICNACPGVSSTTEKYYNLWTKFFLFLLFLLLCFHGYTNFSGFCCFLVLEGRCFQKERVNEKATI